MSVSAGFEHDVLFYDSEEAFLAALVPFLREGLEAGDGAAVATTRDHIGLLRDALGSDGSSVDFLDHTDWYLRPAETVDGWRRIVADSLTRGRPYTRLVGEVRFGATSTWDTTWTRYESALNAVFAGSPAWIVCPYDVRALSPKVLEYAYKTHPIIWTRERSSSERYTEPATLLRELHEPLPAAGGALVVDMRVDSSLADVRVELRAVAARAWDQQGRRDEFMLAVNEVVTNSIRHGKEPRRLSVWLREDSVVCEVRDHGEGVQNPLVGYVPPGPNMEHGMGLWVVARLVDSFAISRALDETIVRLAIART